MKTTLDIADGLFKRAKAHAKATGQPLRALVEEGLRRVLGTPPPAKPYKLRDDLAVGEPWKPGDPPHPFESMTPDEITELIYGNDIEQIMGPAYSKKFEAWAKENDKGKKKK